MRAFATSLVAATLLLGCAEPEADARGVVARLGGDLARGVQLKERPKLHKLGNTWRHRLTANAFEVDVPDAADTLAWSCSSEGASSEFTIELRHGDGPWQPFEGRTLASSPRWQDFERALPPGRSRSLRFLTTTAGGEYQASWGSIRFLGPLAARRRPNVLLISLDTLGAGHLGAYGGPPGVSPHIDAFLESSVSFERAYAQYGNTLVSHSSLFSALHPIRHGVHADSSRRRLRSSLVHALADTGYQTLAFTDGGYVSAGFGFGSSFDHYHDGEAGLTEKRRPGAAFDATLRWLSARPRDEQIFLFVHTYEVHNPYLPHGDAAFAFADQLTPGDDRRLSAGQQARLFGERGRQDTERRRRDLARLEALHRAEIQSLDARLPHFLEEAIAQLRDPIVILLSDHGEQFGEWGRIRHGSSLHDRVIRVPLAFRGPGIEPRAVTTPVELVDVMPTLFELLDLRIPDGLDGRSLAPGFRSEGTLERRPAFAEQRNDSGRCKPGVSRCRVDRVAVVEERFKLIDSRVPEVGQQLFDLEADPLETADVASRHPEVVERLSKLALGYRNRKPRSERRADPPEPGPDDETLEQLRALGYGAETR